jgi:hypothetical protein
MKNILFGLALIGAPLGVAHATPISISTFGSTYTQNFDGLGNNPPFATATGTSPGPILRVSNGTDAATVQGFEFAESGTSTNAQGSYAFSTGDTGVGDSYRFRNSTSSTDLAFGQINTPTFGNNIGANQANPGTAFGLVFRNDTGSTIGSLTLTYRGEQFRYGGATGNPDRIDFQINNNASSILDNGFTDLDGLDFASPVRTGTTGALDGNAAGNFSNISGFYSPTGGIAAGNSFVIRFTPIDQSGSDDGLAIDDFTLTANVEPVPEPSTYALFAIGMVGFGVVVRRRKAADAISGARTSVAGIPC